MKESCRLEKILQANANVSTIKTESMSETKEAVLHSKPFQLRNNRKMNKARKKMISKVQSVPVYEKLPYAGGLTTNGKFLGYKYIFHG